MQELSVFKTFYDLEEANHLALILADNGINVEINDLNLTLSSNIIGDINQGEVYVKILPSDFKRANEIINTYLNSAITNIPSDYYLLELNNKDLSDIIEKPDEWSNQDFIIAQKILKERGYSINETDIKGKADKRMTELAAPENEKKSMVMIGYLFAFLLSIYGVFYGLMLYNAKKLLPDGRQVPTYNERIRNHGYIIAVISIFVIVLAIVRVFTNALGAG